MSAFDPLRTFGSNCIIVCMTMMLLVLISASTLGVSGSNAPDTSSVGAGDSVAMCGLAGDDAQDLIRQITMSSAFRPGPTSGRFRAYDAVNVRLQDWVITQPSEAAHPAVTCREIRAVNGQWVAVRQMHCDGERLACDRLAIEFQAVDEDLGRVLRRRR